jgi:hypothetical protein
MSSDEGWHAIPTGAEFAHPHWIHETLRSGWVRTKTKNGEWTYSGTARLVGASGKPRVCFVQIEGKTYLRHRLMALACGKMIIEQFRDPTVVVMHKKRRGEDEAPDDSPDNLGVGTQKDNNNDPGNRKRAPPSTGVPVRLTHLETGETKDFASASEAARFANVPPGHLNDYLCGGRPNVPGRARGVWNAEYTGYFEAHDAVEIRDAAANLWLSPSRPNEVLRRLKMGAFVKTELVAGADGYVQIRLASGQTKMLHHLVVKTLRPGAFEEKLSSLPPGYEEEDIHVDHLDGNNANNAIDNLVLVTRKEHNRKHAFAVEWIVDGEVAGTYDCTADTAAAVCGKEGQHLDRSAIRRVCDGLFAHTGGRYFRWKDAEYVKSVRGNMASKRKMSEISM